MALINAFRRLLSACFVTLCASFLQCLPTRIWLRIQDRTRIIKKMDYNRRPIYLHVDSWIENEVRLKETQKEPGTVAWIENWFQKGDVFYDIGANVGSYSLIAHQFLDGNMRGYAFEPGFLTFSQLCRNLAINQVNGQISPLQIALSDVTNIIPFHYKNLETGGALHALGDPIDQFGKSFKPVFTLPTLSFRLDDLVAQFSLPTPTHIKIDVDGVELAILQGAESVLSASSLRTILLEVDETSETGRAIDGFLVRCGFVRHSQFDSNSLYQKNK